MKPASKTTAGIPTSHFSNTVLFLTEVLKLEIAHDEKKREFAQFKLPSGQILEVLGSKNLWHPFTSPPDWEVILADIQHTRKHRGQ